MKKDLPAWLLLAMISIVLGCKGGGGGASSFPLLPPANPTARIAIADPVAPVNDRQLSFGSVQETIASEQTITVTNVGTGDLVIGQVASANTLTTPFSITADPCSGHTLPPDATCSLTIRFQPAAAGAFADTFDIPSNDPNAASVTFSLSGTGSATPVPKISVYDDIAPNNDLSVPFGDVARYVSSTQIVRIANIGTANLVIGTVALAEPLAPPFSITADTCSGKTIAPLTSCSLTISFAPTTVNTFTGTFDIPTNDPDTPSATVSVSGTGTAVPDPNILVTDTDSPSADLLVSFGNVAQGNISERTVTVANNGSGNLIVGTVASADPLAAPFSITVNNCSGRTVSPYGYCTLTVRFTPASEGVFTNSFDIPSNDPDTPSAAVSVAGASVPHLAGSIQGDPLALTKAVTTLAGKSPIGYTDGTGAGARFYEPFGVTADQAGNLYVADSGNETIRKIAISTGVVTTLAGSPGLYGATDGTGSAARFRSPSGITTDGTNLYVTETWNYTIRKVVIATGEVTTLAGAAGQAGSTDGVGTAARFERPQGICTDGTNLYVADTVNETIRKIVIATGEVTTLAGSPWAPGSVDGTGSAARFYSPIGIATDGTYVFVVDRDRSIIRKIVISTGAVTTIAGFAGYEGSTDDTGSAARFNYPNGIVILGGNLYIADTANGTIRQLVISTNAVTTLAGTAGMAGSTDGIGPDARFKGPAGITTDGTNLYVADESSNTIRQIVPSSAAVTTLAGLDLTAGSTDGTGSSARFYEPSGITTDGTNLFVADELNHVIRKIVISTGDVTTLAGTAGAAGSADGTGSSARFNRPTGITTDGTNLYIADKYNETIRKIVISTGAVTTVAGSAGQIGSTDGTGATARFYYPRGITTDGTNLYVADTNNHTIRKIVISTGDVSTFAGTAGNYGQTDGIGSAARFYNPRCITTDGVYLYTGDEYHTIRKIVIATAAVSTFAGTAHADGSTDGYGANARFFYPSGLATDGTYLYVADMYNDTIRRITSAGQVSTIAGYPLSLFSMDGTGMTARFYYPYGITTDGVSLFVTDSKNNTIRRID